MVRAYSPRAKATLPRSSSSTGVPASSASARGARPGGRCEGAGPEASPARRSMKGAQSKGLFAERNLDRNLLSGVDDLADVLRRAAGSVDGELQVLYHVEVALEGDEHRLA